MANTESNPTEYYVPHNGWYPVVLAAGLAVMLTGTATFMNDVKANEPGSWTQILLGFAVVAVVLYYWFGKVILENTQGLVNDQLRRSYVWGMGWFIFSEVMFFAAFFGALFYTRTLSVAWLGGEGAKGFTGDYLWPAFNDGWPVVSNPDNVLFPGPEVSMAAPASAAGWVSYLPFYNTVILLLSSVTVHNAHTAIKNEDRFKLKAWLGVTVALGCIFLGLQVEEYVVAYNDMGLTLSSGIYGSTFFLLTGFHGFHVTLGTVILLVQLIRSFRGHFGPKDCFGFEAASWYWHFVDVVWVGLFIFVYVF